MCASAYLTGAQVMLNIILYAINIFKHQRRYRIMYKEFLTWVPGRAGCLNPLGKRTDLAWPYRFSILDDQLQSSLSFSLSAHNVLSVNRNAKHRQKRHRAASFFSKTALAGVSPQSVIEREREREKMDGIISTG
jgi:hypothetical protein